MPSLALSNITSLWATNASSWVAAELHASYYDAWLLSQPQEMRDPDIRQESRTEGSVVSVDLGSPWSGPHGAWYAASIDLHATIQDVRNGVRTAAGAWQQKRSSFLPDINRFDYGFRLPPSCVYSGEPFPKADNVSTRDSHCVEWDLTHAGNGTVLYSQPLSVRFLDNVLPLSYQSPNAASQHQQWNQSFSIERNRTHDADWLGLSPETIQLTAPVNEISVNDSLATLLDHQDSTVYQVFAKSQSYGTYPWSWGYTAGSVKDRIPASLVIGGADTGQFDFQESRKFLMSQDPGRRFQISIRALNITQQHSGSPNTGTLPVVKPESNLQPATIDTSTPFFLLPPDICDTMSTILGAASSADGSYLITAEHHRLLMLTGYTVSLVLAQLDQLRNVLREIQLSIPYQDLVWPLDPQNGTEGTQVLAIRKTLATDHTILGRTLLQRVHMIADYEQGQYILSPTFGSNSLARPLLQTMQDVRRALDGINRTKDGSSLTTSSKSDDSGRSIFLPVMLGTLGVAFALTIVIGLPCCFWLRRRKRRRRDAEVSREEAMRRTVLDGIFDKPELAGRPKSFMESDSTLVYESPTESARQEIGDKDRPQVVIEEMAAEVPVYEMAADEIVRSPPKAHRS